jgi:hypothetical protein
VDGVQPTGGTQPKRGGPARPQAAVAAPYAVGASPASVVPRQQCHNPLTGGQAPGGSSTTTTCLSEPARHPFGAVGRRVRRHPPPLSRTEPMRKPSP